MREPLEFDLGIGGTRETPTGVDIDVVLSIRGDWGEHLPIWQHTAQVDDPDIPEGLSGASLAYANRDAEVQQEKAALKQARHALAGQVEGLLRVTPSSHPPLLVYTPASESP